MTCQSCQQNRPIFDFTNRCCQIRWLNAAFKPHAKAWLARYRINHGEPAMLALIEAAKAAEKQKKLDF